MSRVGPPHSRQRPASATRCRCSWMWGRVAVAVHRVAVEHFRLPGGALCRHPGRRRCGWRSRPCQIPWGCDSLAARGETGVSPRGGRGPAGEGRGARKPGVFRRRDGASGEGSLADRRRGGLRASRGPLEAAITQEGWRHVTQSAEPQCAVEELHRFGLRRDDDPPPRSRSGGRLAQSGGSGRDMGLRQRPQSYRGGPCRAGVGGAVLRSTG